MGKPIAETKKSVYWIRVNYAMSVKEMVKLGNYDWANSDINTRNFPTTRTGKADIEVELLHFNRKISSGDALKEIDKLGYRAAELHEFLAFGAKYPDVQREFPIIELGSVWRRSDGYCSVASLFRDGLERYLDFGSLGSIWLDCCRFAAVRK